MAKILVIEDNPDIRENMIEILELEGHVVHSAKNGAVGLDLAREHLPEIILCDVLMPETNGFEVLKHLKENSSTSSIPLVFVTASVEKKEMEEGLKKGASAYIRKPFADEELLETINRLLKQFKNIS